MQQGQRIDFDIFYSEHAAPAYRFALRLCGDPDDAEDLAAQALIRAFRKWSSYRHDSSQRTWLCAIVVNEWRMMRRKRSHREDRLEEARTVATTLETHDHDLAIAICSLPEPLREAFLLVKGEGFSHAEAAKIVHVPVGTMYFRVHRAIRTLREKLSSSETIQEEAIHEV